VLSLSFLFLVGHSFADSMVCREPLDGAVEHEVGCCCPPCVAGHRNEQMNVFLNLPDDVPKALDAKAFSDKLWEDLQ
jgi:hypothetical protein